MGTVSDVLARYRFMINAFRLSILYSQPSSPQGTRLVHNIFFIVLSSHVCKLKITEPDRIYFFPYESCNSNHPVNPDSDNSYPGLFFLNDQVNKNSATNSSFLFLPVEVMVTLFPSASLIASFTALVICTPSSQVKKVMPVAFLK